MKPALRDEHRLITAELRGPKLTLFSPDGPLSREELDLLDIFGDSLALEGLLPDEVLDRLLDPRRQNER